MKKKKLMTSEMIALEDYICTNKSLVNISDFINELNIPIDKTERAISYLFRATIMPLNEIKDDIHLYDTNSLNPTLFVYGLMEKYFEITNDDDKSVIKYAQNCIIERIREVRIITKYEENIKNNSKKRTKNL